MSCVAGCWPDTTLPKSHRAGSCQSCRDGTCDGSLSHPMDPQFRSVCVPVMYSQIQGSYSQRDRRHAVEKTDCYCAVEVRFSRCFGQRPPPRGNKYFKSASIKSTTAAQGIPQSKDQLQRTRPLTELTLPLSASGQPIHASGRKM